jgi:hypothetical protein
MLYNPAPLNRVIAKACFKAWDQTTGPSAGSRVDEKYADRFLKQAVEKNYGRAVFSALDDILP